MLFVAIGDDDPATRAAGFALSTDARRAGIPTQIELAGRSIKGQYKHADRLGTRFVATVSGAGVELKDFESGDSTAFDDRDAALAAVLRGKGVA